MTVFKLRLVHRTRLRSWGAGKALCGRGVALQHEEIILRVQRVEKKTKKMKIMERGIRIIMRPSYLQKSSQIIIPGHHGS